MSSIYNDKNTLVQFGCTTYKDRDEFKERLNYKIKNLYNYPCCQLLELLILFSEYIPEDYPELFKDMPNNRLSGCCVLINYQIQEFLRRALIAGSLKVVKEGVRQDALDTYIEPKSAYMLLLSSNIYLSFHGYLETEALKKLVFGDSEKVVTVKKIESPEYTPTYKIDDKNVPDTKTRDTMVLKGNSQQHTSAINHAVSKLREAYFPSNEEVIEYLKSNKSDYDCLEDVHKTKGITYKKINGTTETMTIDRFRKHMSDLRASHKNK